MRVVSPVVRAECPEDGGKWAIHCEHFDAAGNLVESSILQDTNRRRLAEWRSAPDEWCCVCQEAEKGEEVN